MLRKRELQWCGPDDVKKLCPRCSSFSHSAKDCDTFNSKGRGRSDTPKSLLNNYERFKPAGYKPISNNRDNNRSRNRSNSRSRSRSRSNSRSSRSNNTSKKINNNNDKSSSSTSNHPRPNSKGRNVTYANAAAGSSQNRSLDDSIHSPKNKGKGKEIIQDTPPAPLIEGLLLMIKELTT